MRLQKSLAASSMSEVLCIMKTDPFSCKNPQSAFPSCQKGKLEFQESLLKWLLFAVSNPLPSAPTSDIRHSQYSMLQMPTVSRMDVKVNAADQTYPTLPTTHGHMGSKIQSGWILSTCLDKYFTCILQTIVISDWRPADSSYVAMQWRKPVSLNLIAHSNIVMCCFVCKRVWHSNLAFQAKL